MSSYESMRHFADSWGLLFMALVFAGVLIHTLRPGRRREHRDMAEIPFRHEDRPASSAGPRAKPEESRR